MAFLTGFIKNDVDSIFKLPLSFPVKGLMVFEMKGIQVMKTRFHFGAEMPEISFWRQVAFRTTNRDPTFCGVMYRLLPGCIGLCMDMAGLAVGIGACVLNDPVCTDNHECPDKEACQGQYP
jgi:hypothetical protein